MDSIKDHAIVIVGTESDEPFTDDIVSYCGQTTESSDIISLKTFSNGEFCPRFISDEKDFNNIGAKLAGVKVVIVSTDSSKLSRSEMAWRTMLVARAAKDNGASKVLLVEPDLFYSAQDRGPRPEHGKTDFKRDGADYKKFDGQPFTSQLYAELLVKSGVDAVLTVHNHSASVEKLFGCVLPDKIMNLNPAEVFADYILSSDVAPSLRSGKGLLLCAPDKGARAFTKSVHDSVGMENCGLLFLSKKRFDERNVSSEVSGDSPSTMEDIKGRDAIIFDDMVRTGGTVKECSRLLKEAGACRVVFFVTHFHSSAEARQNLSNPALDEIVTTNTLPYILNRDKQGRLRRKMTVLKLEKWISGHILEYLGFGSEKDIMGRKYTPDMSSKNPRSSASAERAARKLILNNT